MTLTPEEMQRELDRLLCRMRAIHPPPPAPTPCVPHEPHPLNESEIASVNGTQAA